MTRTASKLREIMVSLGLDVPPNIKIQRTYAGKHQKDNGAPVWTALCADTNRTLGIVSSYQATDLIGYRKWAAYRDPVTKEYDIYPGSQV